MNYHKDLRVLHVTDIMAPRYGGPVTAIKNFCKGQAKQGVKVVLISTDRDYPTGRLANSGVISTGESNFKQLMFPAEWNPLGYSPSLKRYIEDNHKNFDIIHIHGLYRYAHFIAAKIANLNNIPYIVSTHGTLDPEVYYKPQRKILKRIYEFLIEKKNLRRASAIHYTAYDEMILAERLGIYKTPGFVVPNGIDPSIYERLPIGGSFRKKYNVGEGLMVLFCGRITEAKGVKLLIHAFAKLLSIRNSSKLVLAGPDNENYWPQCLPLVSKLGIDKNVILTGMLNSGELTQAYVDADILTLPSYSENFGMVIAEAMFCGTPVLISNRVKIWKDIQDEKAGVISSCDIESVTNSLLECLLNKEKLIQLGLNAKVAARKLYSLELVTRKMIDNYNGIIDKTQSGAR
jgi:glycosyltransferase involved in cell wall biosynthesis